MKKTECCRGVSLVEVLVVLGLIGVVAAVGLPNLRNAQTRKALNAPMKNLEMMSSMARLQAVNNGSQAVLAFLSEDVSDEFSGHSFSGTNVAVVFLDEDRSGLWESGELIAERFAIPAALKYKRPTSGDAIDAPDDRIVFRPTGAIAGRTTCTVYIGDELGNHQRLVFNGFTGQVKREMNKPGTTVWLSEGRMQEWGWKY